MVDGIGTGLDVQGIVDGLMGLQKRNLNQLNDKKNQINYQQTAFKQIKDALNSFEKKLEALSATLHKNIYKVVSSDEKITSAVTSSGSVAPGIYNLNVTQLATAQQLASSAFSSKTDALGISGDLTMNVNGTQFSMVIDGQKTLEQLKDNINTSNSNPGVTASIIKVTDAQGADEYRLILSANETGSDNAILLGGNALSHFDFSQELRPAQNAQFTLNGFSVERSSNMISDVLDGVTFHLNGQLGQSTISIESDIGNEESAMTSAIKDVVDAYNSIVGTLSKNQTMKYLRDSAYSLIKVDLKRGMEHHISTGEFRSLLDLGIKLDSSQVKTNEDGIEYVIGDMLAIDSNLLSKAIKDHASDVVNLFTNNVDGIIKNVTSTLNDLNDRIIFNREQSITQQNRLVENKINDEETRLADIRQRLVIKYAALDSFLEHYNQVSSFLTQQLEALTYTYKK